MTPKLYKAGEVCDLVQVQPYVLRSWEKEFPGIGVQKSPDSPRFYRQSDVEHVQRIKQLVFGEGLTVSGARRRLEETSPGVSRVSDAEVADVMKALGADAKSRLAHVREGLRELQALLAGAPVAGNGEPGFVLRPPSSNGSRPKAAKAVKGVKAVKAPPAATRGKPAKRSAVTKSAAGRKKTPAKKSKRAHA